MARYECKGLILRIFHDNFSEISLSKRIIINITYTPIRQKILGHKKNYSSNLKQKRNRRSIFPYSLINNLEIINQFNTGQKSLHRDKQPWRKTRERERERKHKFCGKCRRVSSISKGKYGDETQRAASRGRAENTGGEKCCRKTGRNEHKARTARVVEVGEKKGEGIHGFTRCYFFSSLYNAPCTSPYDIIRQNPSPSLERYLFFILFLAGQWSKLHEFNNPELHDLGLKDFGGGDSLLEMVYGEMYYFVNRNVEGIFK